MRTRLMLLVLLGLIAFWACSMPKPNPKPPPPLPEGPVKIVPPAYYIVPKDVIEILVWQHADLSRDVIVRPDGKIAMPLIGDFTAIGLTLAQLDEGITKQLSKYVRAPDISLAIKKFGGQKIFILGAVKKPGVYKFVGSTRLVEAITMAGGHTRAAKLKQVLVVRGDPKKPEVLMINVKDIIIKGDFSKNIVLLPKDIIYVPTTLIANITQFVRDYLGSLYTAAYALVTVDYFRKR